MRQQMKRANLSANELGRRLAPSPENVKSKQRLVKRLRSGETRSIKPETAADLERVLGTRGVFTQFVEQHPRRGTRAELEQQIAAYAEEQRRLRRRLEKLERRIAKGDEE